MAFDPTKDYITREEKYLTAMAGNSSVEVPEPITRFEHYLKAIIDNISSGGGGGGGGGVLFCNMDMQTGALDKTWKEISDACSESIVAIYINAEGNQSIAYLSSLNTEGGYAVNFFDGTGSIINFIADSENGYPVFTPGE